ncbi:FAD dependent oxidoreductase [Marinomonas sp. MED121]|uniref:NAD(P)/FAD-dependent oxidoreductase n=1 Tax=Marinomonas sp. MED121 TaxID=314277 RepID=UPI000069126F|nr:FAD-binding oxidoreductase [Marinomonas sp. MED121]EAQ63531.1 FAD dependent oxidoreductase [Marinomonas sp. MED121]
MSRKLGAIQPIYRSGIHIKDAVSVDHPGEITQSYIDLFVKLGGQVIRDDIKRLSKRNEKVILHGRHQYIADEVVIAAGPWSNDLLKTISSPLPMCFERGYHKHFAYPQGEILTRPIYDVDYAFVLSPMTQGYRLTSGSELNDKDAEINTVQLEKAIKSVQNSAVLGEPTNNSLWKGNRPTLPDSLPAIGPHPKCKHVWLAFGHQHVGFSTGPTTGRLIAELMLDQVPFIAITPFLPKRFF